MKGDVAVERIERLENLARAATAEGEVERAREYVRTARGIAQRHRISLPRSFAHRTCDRCDAFLVPGNNARVRLQSGAVVISCDCGEIARYPYGD